MKRDKFGEACKKEFIEFKPISCFSLFLSFHYFHFPLHFLYLILPLNFLQDLNGD